MSEVPGKAEELRDRTKRLLCELSGCFNIHTHPTRKLLANSYCDRGLRWAPTTVLLVGPAPGRSSLKIGMVVEEADESVFWLECLAEQANELLAIFAASQRTAKGNR